MARALKLLALCAALAATVVMASGCLLNPAGW